MIIDSTSTTFIRGLNHVMFIIIIIVTALLLKVTNAISFPREQHAKGKFIVLNNEGYFQINNITHRFPDKYTVMSYNCNAYFKLQTEYSGVLRSPEQSYHGTIVLGEDIDSEWSNHPNIHILNLRNKYPKYVPIIYDSFKVFHGTNIGLIYRREFGDWLISHRHGILSVGGDSSDSFTKSIHITSNKTSMSINLTSALSWLSDNDSILNISLMDIPDPLRIPYRIPDARFIQTSNGRYFLVSNKHSEHRPPHIYPFFMEIHSSTSNDAISANVNSTTHGSTTSTYLDKIYLEDVTFIETWREDHKNWTPFEFNNEIYFLSSIWPFNTVSVSVHPTKPWFGKMVKLIHQNIDHKSCMPLYNWSPYHHILRGGTQAIKLKSEKQNRYFSIFHSSGNVTFDDYGVLKTYTMGAYTFEVSIDEKNNNKIASRLLSISAIPFIHESWYSGNWSYQPQASGIFDYIVFPLTIMLEDDDNLFLVYGKQDEETWVSRFSLSNILSTMIDVNEDGTCSNIIP